MLGAIVFSGLQEIDGVKQAISAIPAESALSVALYSLIWGALVASLCAWVGAVWTASRQPNMGTAQRTIVIGLLLVGNAAAAFLYYFAFVVWKTPHRS